MQPTLNLPKEETPIKLNKSAFAVAKIVAARLVVVPDKMR